MQINRIIRYFAASSVVALAIAILPTIAGAQVVIPNTYTYYPFGSSYYSTVPFNWGWGGAIVDPIVNPIVNPLPISYGQSFYGGGLYNGNLGRSFDQDDLFRQNRFFPGGDFRRSFEQGRSFDQDRGNHGERDMNRDRDMGNQNRDHR